MIKVSDYIAKRLKEVYEIKHVFMISGGGAMHLNDSFGKYIPYICNHHEQASAIAAEGYARINQKLAVVNVTTGPGGINCLNGVFGQWTDSVPVLYISGQVKYSTSMASCLEVPLRQLGDQETDIISLVKPITKYAAMVTDAKEIKYHLDKAIYEAITGRFGPVWLDIPMNIQSAMVDEAELVEFVAPEPVEYDLKIDEVIEKLKSAKSPVIIAGHGVRLSGQEKTLLGLLRKLDIPVLKTFNGADVLPDLHPNYIGRLGTMGHRVGNFALQNADLILCLGTRNNIRQVSYNYENFAKKAYKIVVDIDSAELEKPTVVPDLKIHADLAEFLPELLIRVPEIKVPDWLKWCKNLKEKYSFDKTPEYQQITDKINPYYFTHILTGVMQKDDILVTANGTASVTGFQSGQAKEKQRLLWNSGDASMGYDLPAAIGACIAAEGRNTICLAGDGSIMMNLQELQTILHHNLPIKIFVLNNDGYISIKQTQKNFFDGRMTACGEKSGVSVPDFVKIASAFGLKAAKIEKPDNLEEQIKKVLSMDDAVLCEVVLDTDYIFAPKLSARKLEDGTMVSPSLEDMFPFLSEEELKENMFR